MPRACLGGWMNVASPDLRIVLEYHDINEGTKGLSTSYTKHTAGGCQRPRGATVLTGSRSAKQQTMEKFKGTRAKVRISHCVTALLIGIY